MCYPFLSEVFARICGVDVPSFNMRKLSSSLYAMSVHGKPGKCQKFVDVDDGVSTPLLVVGTGSSQCIRMIQKKTYKLIFNICYGYPG